MRNQLIIIPIFFLIFLISFSAFTQQSWALSRLGNRIQKEINSNPFLKNAGIKLKVIDEEKGYVTIKMLEGNRKIRDSINKGYDIFTPQFEIDWGGLFGSSPSVSERKTLNTLRKSLSYIKENIKGVKEIMLTAAVNTQLDEAMDLNRKANNLEKRKEYIEAAKLYQTAAVIGYSEAQFNLARMYMLGRGVKKNHAAKIKWSRMSAEQGHKRAQCYLGYFYERGSGVKQDFAAAENWYRKAAEQGLPLAQWNLGGMYIKGKGVTRDYAAGESWLRKAAEQQFVPAQNSLAWFYSACNDPKYHNGEKAIRYALSATAQEPNNWSYLDTLAGAYARNRQFKEAVKIAQKSIALLENDTKTTAKYKKEALERAYHKLNLYKNGQAYMND